MKNIDTLVYANEITINDDNTVNVYFDGESVWESFTDIMNDIEDNNLNPVNCTLYYSGTFGSEFDEWTETIKDVIDKVNALHINTEMLDEDEKSFIEKVITHYNIDSSKIIFD